MLHPGHWILLLLLSKDRTNAGAHTHNAQLLPTTTTTGHPLVDRFTTSTAAIFAAVSTHRWEHLWRSFGAFQLIFPATHDDDRIWRRRLQNYCTLGHQWSLRFVCWRMVVESTRIQGLLRSERM
uniref:Putative secreted peptide n=1 Tax=Anopheles braziliensis TaxID=58242 RepID=A0A2M3ZTU0_9DIPT